MGNYTAKVHVINYYITQEDEQQLLQISANSLSKLEWYLNTYFTKKVRLNQVENQENALNVKYIPYLGRAQQENLTIKFNPNVSHLIFYQHGSDMSGIIRSLPKNVASVSLNSDGVKSSSNIEYIVNQYLQQKKAASMFFIGVLLIFAFIIIFIELNSRAEKTTRRLVAILENQNHIPEGKMHIVIEIDKSDFEKAKIDFGINADIGLYKDIQIIPSGSEEESNHSEDLFPTLQNEEKELSSTIFRGNEVVKEFFRETETSDETTNDKVAHDTSSEDPISRQDVNSVFTVENRDDLENSKTETKQGEYTTTLTESSEVMMANC